MHDLPTTRVTSLNRFSVRIRTINVTLGSIQVKQPRPILDHRFLNLVKVGMLRMLTNHFFITLTPNRTISSDRTKLNRSTSTKRSRFRLIKVFTRQVGHFIFPNSGSITLSIFSRNHHQTTNTKVRSHSITMRINRRNANLSLVPPRVIGTPTPNNRRIPTNATTTLQIQHGSTSPKLCRIVPITCPFQIPLTSRRSSNQHMQHQVINRVTLPTFVSRANSFSRQCVINRNRNRSVDPTPFSSQPNLATQSTIKLSSTSILTNNLPVIFLRRFVVFFVWLANQVVQSVNRNRHTTTVNYVTTPTTDRYPHNNWCHYRDRCDCSVFFLRILSPSVPTMSLFLCPSGGTISG